MASIDLTRLLPPQYRDKTLDTLIRNLFNRHLSKTDVVPLFGYVGDRLDLSPGDVQIVERDLERQINQLTPIIYTEHGTEKITTSWPDLVNKLLLLGVDYQKLDEWFKSNSYNLVPPIDLDKFCNFNQYFWIGDWITTAPSLPYHLLGIPSLSYVNAVFAASNSDYVPEYYVIKRSTIGPGPSYYPTPPLPDLITWSDWGLVNLWVHREDAINFLNTYGGMIGFSQLKQATRPIIEYSDKIKLNTRQTVLGVPSDFGNVVLQKKIRISQLPLFDLYNRDGSHSGQTSAIFYYSEGSQYPVDSEINRRVATDANSDFIFEHSLYNEATKALRFYKNYDDTNFHLNTIWKKGPVETIKYSKYDSSGTLINQDKFKNYKNYFWVGIDGDSTPPWNPTGLPEYVVIEQGGTSGWSTYNFWVHVSQLPRSDLPKYVQATRPIIEFNKLLESSLTTTKTTIYQLPKFAHFWYNDATDTYEVIPSVSRLNLNDAYLQNTLFARVNDLPTKDAILTSPDVLSTAFEYDGEYYIQGLYTGEFLPDKDGITYGYLGRTSSYQGTGNGVITAITTSSVCIPEVVTLTATSPTTFSVTGSVTGIHPVLTVGTPYTVSGATFSVVAGITPFAVGDTFILEIKSYVFNRQQVFVQVNSYFRTLTSPSTILTEQQSNVIVEANPAHLDGTWEVPSQLEWNVQNETRSKIGQGDLYFHLISIIEAQIGLEGSPTGTNNWRTLPSKDVGLGGKIKQYDGNTALLISILLQQGVTPSALLDFARESYESLFNTIHTFVLDQVPQLLTDAAFKPPQSGDTIDDALFDTFVDFFTGVSPVVSASSTKVDDYITTPFYDTTSSLKNLVVTLPYIGLINPVPPKKVLDLELNLPMLVHHDGHRSKLPTITSDIIRSIVNRKFERSPGNFTSGVIAPAYPSRPYKGQFWYRTTNGVLYYYGVVSDTNERPDSPAPGTFTYDRQADVLYAWDGSNWNVASNTAAWIPVKLDLIEANLTLAIEQYLYENCPPQAQRLNTVILQTNTNYTKYQQQEFERFGVTYGVTDVYSTTYDPDNAFSWNYSAITAPGASGPHAAWQEVYRDVYGTPRPDLEPWVSSGYPNEASFLIAYDIYASNPPGTTTSFDPSTMWPMIASFVHSRLLLLGKPNKLSVDIATGSILPPTSSNVEGLMTTVPSSASDRFKFEDLGPIETYWRKTLNFLYSQQNTYFRIDPLGWIQKTWGIKYGTVGDYELNLYLTNKESASDFMLHGDDLSDVPQISWFNDGLIINSAPPADVTYNITLINRIDRVFKVQRSDLTTPSFFNISFADAYISITVPETLRDFFYGETYTITVKPDATYTDALTYSGKLSAEGFNQVYVQYSRSYGDDLALSVNKNLFSNWKAKLGYRFGGFINTDSLKISSNSQPIVKSAFEVLVKENKFYNSSWIQALRVQLVQRGTSELSQGFNVPKIGPGGTPGEDWIFRVDNFNPAHTEITWYEFDTSGSDYRNFVALDGKRTLFNWKRYFKPLQVVKFNSPFLITGIQNLVNFIFGYADLRAAEGWSINNQENLILDSSTGRPIDYQLLTEQFIVQQFSGADAGSAFLFNPFSRKVWYKTPRGVISDLYDTMGSLEQETTPMILDVNRKRIEKSKVRVFRQDDITEIVFDVPAFTIHLLTSEYEHVVLFENFSAENLIYDPFLGQKTGSVFFNGEKQAEFTGRIDFGGHFLLGDQMKRNIESSVQSILGLYDTTSDVSTPEERERALALLGFQKKDYFSLRNTPEPTEFRFWQGVIGNKGTNFAIDAFVNSQKFKSAKLDEYWAYKIAEYGDARKIEKSEMRSSPEDCTSELTKYLFLEDDELSLIDKYIEDGGYDTVEYEAIPFDSFSIYTTEQAAGMEFFDPRGSVIVTSDDEKRWFRYNDLRSLEYFKADIIAEWLFVPDSIEKCYVIRDAQGNPVRADCFEIVNPEFFEGADSYDMLPYSAVQAKYYERGDYIPGSDPPEYFEPKFKRLNSSTIQLLDPSMVGYPFKVIAYGPAINKYSPNVLFNYKTNTTVIDDIIWWDPARGSHHPQAFREVDYHQVADPATYNVGTLTRYNAKNAKLKPWGENEVGKIWWDTFELDWQFYADTKIYPDMQERLARWGATADYSSVKVYEWIKASKSPEEYEKDKNSEGEIAVKYTINRNRTWFQRTVAWMYSDNPETSPRKFLAYQPADLKLFIGSDGNGVAILSDGNLSSYGVKTDCKIAGAVYKTVGDKASKNVSTVFGMARATDDPSFTIGSSTVFNGGPIFATTTGYSGYSGDSGFDEFTGLLTLSMSVDSAVLSFRDNVLGQYQLSNTIDNYSGRRYIKLTHINSQKNQSLEVRDVPLESGTVDEYNFDEMGIIVTYYADFDRTIGSEISRKQKVATQIGNTAHDIYLRSSIAIFSPIPFTYNGTTYTTLSGAATANTQGWVVWKDPPSNPVFGPKPPYNKYQPILGEWIEVGDFLSDLVDDISIRQSDPWKGFEDEDWNSYLSSWSEWNMIFDEVRDYHYCTTSTFNHNQFFNTYFTFTNTTLTNKELLDRTQVYINNVKIRSDEWTLDTTGTWPKIIISQDKLSKGDRVRAQVAKYTPTKADLEFDPDVKDVDPLVLTQWKYDYPHVYEEKRNSLGGLTIKNYYFWVKNKISPAKGKTMGVKNIATLLRTHDGSYSVPQALKFYNQIDGRPNRYGLLSIKNLGRYVKILDTYKLRLTKNEVLRDDDRNIELKNLHVEWKLLRQYQTSKIPRKLWDLLTNSLAGETELGQALPFEPLQAYDDRNSTDIRYGFTEQQQIFVDPEIGKATMKYTILNTKVNKYVNGKSVIDYIAYPGFDINNIDEYLSTPENIRQFMSDLWRYARPKQLNEIFFAILEDAAAANLELTDFFKTSFISLNDIRTINTPGS